MKANSKTIKTKQSSNCPVNCCSTSHKIWSAIALAGLFACGLILGLTYNEKGVEDKISLTVEQCDAIANEIVNMTKTGVGPEKVEALNQLKDAYSSGCAGRLVIIERTPVVAAEEKSEIMSTCSRIEQLLKERLISEDDTRYEAHLRNADTYSTLAERGCEENADMYKTLALREIEIATALQPEEYMTENDTVIVIDTFKKLNMQREAKEFLNKIEKLIDPATDFILQMEQVINE